MKVLGIITSTISTMFVGGYCIALALEVPFSPIMIVGFTLCTLATVIDVVARIVKEN